MYRKVSPNNIEISVEESLTQMRWAEKETENKNEKQKQKQKEECCQEEDDKVINFNSMKATEMKNNKRVYITEPNDKTLETKCENLKIKIMETVHKYIKENQNIDFSNLDKDE